MNLNLKSLVCLSALVASGTALATLSTDTDFTDVVTLLSSWSQGTLGRVIALSMFVVGLAVGIVRQSVIAAVAGVAGALTLRYGPDVVEGIFGALI